MWGVHPYSGEVRPAVDPFGFGLYPQSMNTDQRFSAAKAMASGPAKGMFDYYLLDSMAPGNYNPTWCTYGPGPNGGWLIAKDGTVAYAQPFFGHAGMPNTPFEAGEAALEEAFGKL